MLVHLYTEQVHSATCFWYTGKWSAHSAHPVGWDGGLLLTLSLLSLSLSFPPSGTVKQASFVHAFASNGSKGFPCFKMELTWHIWDSWSVPSSDVWLGAFERLSGTDGGVIGGVLAGDVVGVGGVGVGFFPYHHFLACH